MAIYNPFDNQGRPDDRRGRVGQNSYVSQLPTSGVTQGRTGQSSIDRSRPYQPGTGRPIAGNIYKDNSAVNPYRDITLDRSGVPVRVGGTGPRDTRYIPGGDNTNGGIDISTKTDYEVGSPGIIDDRRYSYIPPPQRGVTGGGNTPTTSSQPVQTQSPVNTRYIPPQEQNIPTASQQPTYNINDLLRLFQGYNFQNQGGGYQANTGYQPTQPYSNNQVTENPFIRRTPNWFTSQNTGLYR